ncbi:hypothetical protein AC579_4260 [Pseudocercospora musae]|uniref:Secreted protein n=1 Tax=Pseudocercospora musae TaxID=113226 RepID=A0A139I6X7_9PEZI|nr:hypothetical protein AC579_4260 [Pseudocercospora musae]
MKYNRRRLRFSLLSLFLPLSLSLSHTHPPTHTNNTSTCDLHQHHTILRSAAINKLHTGQQQYPHSRPAGEHHPPHFFIIPARRGLYQHPHCTTDQRAGYMYSSHANAFLVEPPPLPQQPFRILRRPRSSGHERNNG